MWIKYNELSNRARTSVAASVYIIGLISTVMSVAGYALRDWIEDPRIGMLIILGAFVLFAFVVYVLIGLLFKDSVSMAIRQTPVTVCCGDIFEAEGWRVIGCDTRFDTRVDDIVIARKSLHGRLVLEHGKAEEIRATVERAAARLSLVADDDGLYAFPLGSVVRYDSSVDGHTYLMLAMNELDDEYKAHTNMAQYERMLMRMWTELDRVYASNPIALPLLGSGITRFDDGPKDGEALLKCMLCTLKASGVSLNSDVKVIIYGKAKDIPLFEYKDLFRDI